MRQILIGAILALLASAPFDVADAQSSEYTNPWCIEGKGGGLDCSFHSFEQCNITRRGQGGDCVPNPFASQVRERDRSGDRSNDRSRYR
jgi:hypothetical protein